MNCRIGDKSPPFIQIFFMNLCPFFRKENSFLFSSSWSENSVSLSSLMRARVSSTSSSTLSLSSPCPGILSYVVIVIELNVFVDIQDWRYSCLLYWDLWWIAGPSMLIMWLIGLTTATHTTPLYGTLAHLHIQTTTQKNASGPQINNY